MATCLVGANSWLGSTEVTVTLVQNICAFFASFARPTIIYQQIVCFILAREKKS